jgi:hypothetical protein
MGSFLNIIIFLKVGFNYLEYKRLNRILVDSIIEKINTISQTLK